MGLVGLLVTRLSGIETLSGSLRLPSLHWGDARLLRLYVDELMLSLSPLTFCLRVSSPRASIDLDGRPGDDDPTLLSSIFLQEQGMWWKLLMKLAQLIPLPRVVVEVSSLDSVIQTDHGDLMLVLEGVRLQVKYPYEYYLTCSIKLTSVDGNESSLPLLELTAFDLSWSKKSCTIQIEDCLLHLENIAAVDSRLRIRTTAIKLLSIVTRRRLMNSELQDLSDLNSTPYFDAYPLDNVPTYPWEFRILVQRLSVSEVIANTSRRALSMHTATFNYQIEDKGSPVFTYKLNISDISSCVNDGFVSLVEKSVAEETFELMCITQGNSHILRGKLLPCTIQSDLSTLRSAKLIGHMISQIYSLASSPIHRQRLHRFVNVLDVNISCSRLTLLITSNFEELVRCTFTSLCCYSTSVLSLNLALESINVDVSNKSNPTSVIQTSGINVYLTFFDQTAINQHSLLNLKSGEEWNLCVSSLAPSYVTNIQVDSFAFRVEPGVLLTLSRIMQALITFSPDSGLHPLRIYSTKLRGWSSKLMVSKIAFTLDSTDDSRTTLYSEMGGVLTVTVKGLGLLSRIVDVSISSGMVEIFGKSIERKEFRVAAVQVKDSCLATSFLYPAELFISSSTPHDMVVGIIRYASFFSAYVLLIELDLISTFLNPVILTLQHFPSITLNTIICHDPSLRSSIALYHVSIDEITIAMSRQKIIGRFHADTIQLDSISHGSSLSLSKLSMRNPDYSDFFYADSKFRVLFSHFEERGGASLQLFYSALNTTNPILEVDVPNARFVYLQRAMMTITSFVQDLYKNFNLVPMVSSTISAIEPVLLSTQIYVRGRMIECIIPVNSYSNDAIVIIAETVRFHMVNADTVDFSERNIGSWVSENCWLSFEKATDLDEFDIGILDSNFFDEIAKYIRARSNTSSELLSLSTFSISNATICSMCNNNVITSGLNLEGNVKIEMKNAISEGIYASVEQGLGFRYREGKDLLLSSVAVEVDVNDVEINISQGQYLVSNMHFLLSDLSECRH